jgi:two-component system NarL family sensor kinase
MDAPAEVEFGQLLLTGIGLMLLAAGALVLFVVTYQKRLLQQQLALRTAEAAYQQQLLAAVVEAQEGERERIGRELHDGIGSTISTAKMLINRLAHHQLDDNRPELFGLVTDIMTTAVHDVRSISHSLFPAVLARYGLADALQHLVDVSNETGALAIELEVDYPQPLPLAQELALYRICQELVHNALKHAKGATHLDVLLRQRGPLLTLAVEDDGCGFVASAAADATALPPTTGAGLRSIDVRVQLLHARLHQHTAPGQGVRTVVEVQSPA